MSLFEEPHLEPQPAPEKPKKKKLLSIGIGAALIVAVLVTSVVAFSFGQSGKPADNVLILRSGRKCRHPLIRILHQMNPRIRRNRRIRRRLTVRRKRLLQAVNRRLTPQRERINTKPTRYRMESPHLRSRKMPKSIHRRNIPARSPLPAKRSLTTWTR